MTVSVMKHVFRELITLPIGKNNDVPDDQFDPDELKKGIQHELEHTDDLDVAKAIAKDHLVEDPKYYSKLEEIFGHD